MRRSTGPKGDWDSVGRICERVVADGLDPARLDGLVSVGVDKVSWKRHHNYLTLVTDHTGKKIVWGVGGKDTAADGRRLLTRHLLWPR